MTTPAPTPCTPSCGTGTPTVVTAGPGADVTGTGAPATPYVVSAAPSTDVGNVLTLGTDGNVFLDCADIAACGGGGTIVTGGPGTDVTPIPGGFQVTAAPSTDAGNRLTLGADGNLRVTCTDIAGCVTVQAGPGADVTGNGAPGTPYIVSAAPSVDVGNVLTLGADGNMFLDCADIAGCVSVIANPLTPETSVTGAGTVANPFVITNDVPLTTPRARIHSVGDIVIQNRVAGGEAVPMGVTTYDRGGLFNIGTPTRLTVPAGWDGVYSLGGNAQFRAGADENEGFRAAFIRLNGGTVLAFEQDRSVLLINDSTILNVHTDMELVAGDFIELYVQQSQLNPEPITLAGGAEFTAALWLTFLHR